MEDKMSKNRTTNRAKRTSTDLPYFQTFFGPRVRPNGRMRIEAHQECGRLLRQVVRAVERRRGAHTLVLYTCNTLDDWAMREYTPDELDNPTLTGLYCQALPSEPEISVSRDLLIERLERVKSILATYYPDGLGLRRMVRDLDRAIASISSWSAIALPRA